MKFLSVCSGIEAASVAFNPLGWHATAFSEVDPFCCALLKHHYPDVPNYGDLLNHRAWPDAPIDAIIGGTPCQAFSVAGGRNGMADPRGQLTRVYLDLVNDRRPRWVVWENVPGVLSIDGGRTFGTILETLGQCGYGVAYRVLDAQYWGVPQRRRRVFVVGHIGAAWQRAAAVLFEPEGMRGRAPPRRQEGQEVTGTLSARARGGGGLGTDMECAGGLVAHTLNAKGGSGRHDAESETLPVDRFGVRRLMPIECERLQGFPDHYTAVPFKGRMAKDGPRYKAIGNSMAVPVMRWIGERMAAVDAIKTT